MVRTAAVCFNSFSPAGVGTEEDETRVKAYMQRWLNVVCANRQLMRDDEIIRFVEGDPGYSPVIKKSQPATGARRKYLKQFAPPPDDTPELFEARPVVKSFYLGTMDAGQKVERAVKAKKGMYLPPSLPKFRLQILTVETNRTWFGRIRLRRKIDATRRPRTPSRPQKCMSKIGPDAANNRRPSRCSSDRRSHNPRRPT